MVPRTKKGLIVLGAVVLALASAFAGGTYGFLQGYVYGLGDTGAKAFTLTTTLRTLREGDVAKGISRLEGDLDTLIIEHRAIGRSDPPLLSWFVRANRDDAIDDKLFARVARYRIEYPSSAPAPEVSDAITSHLKGFQP